PGGGPPMLAPRMIALLALAVPTAALAATDRAGATGQTTSFTVRIENVSTPEALKLSTGGTGPALNSPGVWVVARERAPLFKAGRVDPGLGLEAQAEDGDPGPLGRSVAEMKGVLASGVFDTPAGDDHPGPALPGKAYEFSF